MLKQRSSVRILEADPELGHGLTPAQLAAARHELVAVAGTVEPGDWEPLKDLSEDDRHLGLLVIDGLLLRDIAVASTTCAELVGKGDVLRPWEHFGDQAPMPYEVSWRVLEPTRIAVLDRRSGEVVCRYPELMTALVARTVARAHALALSLAVTCITGVRIRLLVLLWHLADRWGRVTPNGVFVPLRLTHETLGKLIGARRPSVSTALGELQGAGLVDAGSEGWTLHGDAPEEVRRMHDRRRMTRDLEAAS